jgi:hypothetical protein
MADNAPVDPSDQLANTVFMYLAIGAFAFVVMVAVFVW